MRGPREGHREFIRIQTRCGGLDGVFATVCELVQAWYWGGAKLSVVRRWSQFRPNTQIFQPYLLV